MINQQLDRLSPHPGSPLASIESDGTAPHSTPSQRCSHAPSPDEDQDLPDWHDLANSKVGSEIDRDESGGEEQDFWEDLIYECVSRWVNRESCRMGC